MGVTSIKEILAVDHQLSVRFFQWVWRKPGLYFESIRNEFMRLLFKTDEYYPDSLIAHLPWVPPIAIRFERGLIYQPIGLLLFFGMVSFSFINRKRLAVAILFFGSLIYIVLISSIQLGFTRYSIPLIPCLLVFLGQVSEGMAISFFTIRYNGVKANPNPDPKVKNDPVAKR